MTLLDSIPEWLRHFRLMVKTKGETVLFDSWRDDIKLLKFDDQSGGQIGTNIKLFENSNGSYKIHKIVTIRIYTDMTTLASDLKKEVFGIQLDLVV